VLFERPHATQHKITNNAHAGTKTPSNLSTGPTMPLGHWRGARESAAEETHLFRPKNKNLEQNG
jgi:hypothetical protein